MQFGNQEKPLDLHRMHCMYVASLIVQLEIISTQVRNPEMESHCAC